MALWRLCYGRVSTSDQNIDLQITQFEALGYDEIFVEKLSGRKIDRPEFIRLADRALELRSQGHDVVVYVIEWTRWARRTWFALQQLERLEKSGCTIIEATTGQSVTMQTSDGALSVGMKSLLAEHYSLQLSERQKRSYQDKRSKGKPMSGAAPFGYARSPENSRFVPGKEWGIGRELVEMFLGGASQYDLCRFLWSKYKIKRSPRGVKGWLRNPVLRGHIQYQDGTLLLNRHEPLITEAEYRAIQHRFKLSSQLRGFNKGKIYAVPTGMLRCFHCNRSLTTLCNRSHRYFFCKYARQRGDCSAPRKLCRQDWIEAAIQEAIVERAEEIANALLTPKQISSPLILEKEKELEALKPLAHRPNIQAEIEAIEAEIEQIQIEEVLESAGEQQVRQAIQDLAWSTSDEWTQLTEQQRRAIYCDLVKYIQISGAEIVRVELKG